MRSWNLKSKSHTPLDCIAQMVNPILRGWANYYGKLWWKIFSKITSVLRFITCKMGKS